MTLQKERAHLFANLHIKGDPLILFNIWDAGSARAMQEAGAKALGTSSWAVAASHGYEDGERLPFDLALANLKRIIAAVHLPVSIDLEGGYGKSPSAVQDSAVKVMQAGAVGINFEDQVIGGEGLYVIAEQCARIKAIRGAAEHMSIPLFINARTDLFFKADSNQHHEHRLEEAIHRACAYAENGANGFFVPGLKDVKSIGTLCERSPIPVNIMVLPDTPSLEQLAYLGVARISFGPGPYIQMMNALKKIGQGQVY